MSNEKTEIEIWFEKYGAAKVLKQNLELNMGAIRMSEQDRRTLLLMNLIVIKSCLQDCGLE